MHIYTKIGGLLPTAATQFSVIGLINMGYLGGLMVKSRRSWGHCKFNLEIEVWNSVEFFTHQILIVDVTPAKPVKGWYVDPLAWWLFVSVGEKTQTCAYVLCAVIREFVLKVFYFWCSHACTQLSICSEALTLQIVCKKLGKMMMQTERDSETR